MAEIPSGNILVCRPCHWPEVVGQPWPETSLGPRAQACRLGSVGRSRTRSPRRNSHPGGLMAQWDEESVAAELLACEAQRRDREPFTDEWPNLDVDTGYRIQ